MRTLKAALPAVLCVSVLALAGCSGKKAEPVKPQVVEETEALGAAESLDSPVTLGIGEGRTTEGMLPIYFGYDSSGIPSDQISRMEVNADFMRKNSGVNVRIEGNCDPRGTKEYNLALGERRAQAARLYLQKMGIGTERLTTVSYGKERLLFPGHDEMAWAQDRRDDFVVTGGTGVEVVGGTEGGQAK